MNFQIFKRLYLCKISTLEELKLVNTSAESGYILNIYSFTELLESFNLKSSSFKFHNNHSLEKQMLVSSNEYCTIPVLALNYFHISLYIIWNRSTKIY